MNEYEILAMVVVSMTICICLYMMYFGLCHDDGY